MADVAVYLSVGGYAKTGHFPCGEDFDSSPGYLYCDRTAPHCLAAVPIYMGL